MEILLFLLVFGGFVIGSVILYFFVFIPTSKFYVKLRALEEKVKTEDNKDEQLMELFELDKQSWHRSTGEEIRRVATLMEFKYKIKLLK